MPCRILKKRLDLDGAVVEGARIGGSIAVSARPRKAVPDARSRGGGACLVTLADRSSGFLTVDVTTGDRITPGPVAYEYPLLFGEGSVTVMSYTLDTCSPRSSRRWCRAVSPTPKYVRKNPYAARLELPECCETAKAILSALGI